MDSARLATVLNNSRFATRRAIERLREGLYDPFAVRLLTAHRDELNARFDAGTQRLETGKSAHLCVCGPYGQGKSHSLTYLRQRALEQGYAVSMMNLDPRQAPLHLFRQVYRALLATLTFPPHAATSALPTSLIEAWQAWAEAQPVASEEPTLALAQLLPTDMPHALKATLVALTQATLHVPAGKRGLQQYRDYRPADFPTILRRTLLGESVPAARLRPALKYRQVAFYRQDSLALSGDAPFLHMTLALGQLFRRMGYKGWALLFDEGEAITQVRAPLRARSYHVLHHLFYPPSAPPGVYSIFAFTADFFQQLRAENYDLPYFEQNYATAWRDLSVYQLRSLSQEVWLALGETLIALHGAAYQWPAPPAHLIPLLSERLGKLPLQDTRTTLKALVDTLDRAQQQQFFAQAEAGG